MKSVFDQNGGTYIKVGDYYLPNLTVPTDKKYNIGKYGRIHGKFIKENYPCRYSSMLIQGTWLDYLERIDRAANAYMQELIKIFANKMGISEELKATDQMKWVGLMNSAKSQAEEIVCSQYIYSKIFEEACMMKKIITILISVITMSSACSVQAAQVPSESLPCDATEEQIIVTEKLVGHIFDEVINGLGYADARAKSNVIIFNAWLNNQTNGYAYGELVNIANNAIWQYRDLYLRPDFYAENEERVKTLIADVLTQYQNGEIDYNKACFEVRIKIYQSVNPSFNPDIEFVKDSCYRDIPSVDSSLFAIARKLLQNTECRHAQDIK